MPLARTVSRRIPPLSSSFHVSTFRLRSFPRVSGSCYAPCFQSFHVRSLSSLLRVAYDAYVGVVHKYVGYGLVGDGWFRDLVTMDGWVLSLSRGDRDGYTGSSWERSRSKGVPFLTKDPMLSCTTFSYVPFQTKGGTCVVPLWCGVPEGRHAKEMSMPWRCVPDRHHHLPCRRCLPGSGKERLRVPPSVVSVPSKRDRLLHRALGSIDPEGSLDPREPETPSNDI